MSRTTHAKSSYKERTRAYSDTACRRCASKSNRALVSSPSPGIPFSVNARHATNIILTCRAAVTPADPLEPGGWRIPLRFCFVPPCGGQAKGGQFFGGWSIRWRTGGQTGSFPSLEISNQYEPNERCQTNIRKRSVCPQFPCIGEPSQPCPL